MSGKDQKPSKKAVREKKEKTIDEATFGLKNKNKSKKVQQFINRVEKSVKNQNGGADAVSWIGYLRVVVQYYSKPISYCIRPKPRR